MMIMIMIDYDDENDDDDGVSEDTVWPWFTERKNGK